MITLTRCAVAIYVDRATQQWIVRDGDGKFWIVPPAAGGWENRQPFEPAADSDLTPIPGHYKYLLKLPF
jgi:hypothetical protein